jgi:serine protease AprX
MVPLFFRQFIRVPLFCVLAFQILIGFSPVSAFIPETSLSLTLEERNKIDPRVWQDTSQDGSGRFLLVLNRQVDAKRLLSGFPSPEKEARRLVEVLRQEAGDSQPELIGTLKALGLKFRPYWIVNTIAVEGHRSSLETLARRSDVKRIESNRPFPVGLERPDSLSLDDPQGVEWNISWVKAPALWALGFQGQNRVYANADTGVQWEHPGLKPQYRGWTGTRADHNFHWWDAVHEDLSGNGSNPCGFNSPLPCDDHGHGTHTLGTGIGDDGAGNQIGMAPKAKWISCRNMEEGFGQPSTYLECFQFFMAPTDLGGKNPDPDKRPDAVGNSYGCPPEEGCSTESLSAALENLRAAGIFIAASAGNTGPGCSTISNPPGLNDAAITVGATGFQSNGIAAFSSRGPVTVDGSQRGKPDLVAPGADVRSSYPPDNYATLSGTSMAAPHLAGAALLLWSSFPALARQVDQTEFILTRSAQHLPSTQGCGGDSPLQIPNNAYGYGLLDTLAAYQSAMTPWLPVFLPLILKN